MTIENLIASGQLTRELLPLRQLRDAIEIEVFVSNINFRDGEGFQLVSQTQTIFRDSNSLYTSHFFSHHYISFSLWIQTLHVK